MVTSNRGSQQLDSQGTPRYATFNSTKVLICGYPEADAAALSKAIEQEGGKVLKKYYKGSRPDVIVCGTVADRNCKEARKAWQDAVPVVTRDWVEACTKQKAQVSFGPYKLGALVGLEISATNFQQKERMLLQKLVQSAGGTYSAELFKGRTTHLMCKNGTGKKYSAAVQWRSVHVVTDAWLRDSVTLGYPAPETNYKVDPILEARQAAQTTEQPAAAPAAAVPQPQAISESVMFGGPPDNRTASTATDKQQQAAEAQQQQQQEASSKSKAKRPAAAAAAAAFIEQQAASSKSRRSSQQLSQPPASSADQEAAAAGAAGAAAAAAKPAADAAAAAAQVQPVNSTDSRLAALGLTDAEAAPVFLERVVLWWCGIPEGSSEHKELQAILHAYAGVRFPDMHDITTHIMIGKHAKVEELKAVQQYLGSCNRRVEVVSAAWLELCHEEQRCVPVDARCRLQLASLMRGSGSHPLGAAGAGALGSGGGLLAAGGSGGGGGGVFADTASRGGFTEAADRQQQDAAAPEFWHEQPTDPLKLFDGCYFTLAAVQSHQADHEKALGYIRRLGGKVFTADSTKPPPRWPKVFAVCPASLTREAEASLVAADASFRLVHPSCRVTTHWMDICVKHSQLVRVTPRNPLLSPLRFALPLRDFANVSIAVTGYKEGQRSTIEKLVVLLGGSFCKTLGRHQRPTHLMLPSWGPDSAAAAGRADPADAAPAVDGQGTADGTGVGSASQQQQQLLPESTVKKIAYAMKHRVEMVVSEWLLDCAAEGRRVQEGLHRPEGDLSLLELPAGGCGATQAGGGGATQLLPATQLPQTQQQTQAAGALGSRQQPPAPAGMRSLASLLSGQAPLPRPPPSGSRIVAAAAATTTAPSSSTAAAPAAAAADGSDAAAAAAPAPAPTKPSNWFTANLVNSSSRAATHQQPPQQQQQDVQDQQQQVQQQDSKQLPYGKAATPPQQPAAQQQQQPSVTPGRSSRKRSAAAAAAANAAAPTAPGSDQAGGAAAAAAAAAAFVQEEEALDVAPQQHKRQCKQQPQQQGVPQQPQGDVGRDAGAAAVAAAVAVVVGATAGGATTAAAAAIEAGTDGQHDAALTDVLSMLATFSNKEAATVPASQAMAGDILQLPDTLLSAGRMGSGGCCGSGAAGTVGSGGGGGGSGGVQSGGVGQGARGRRRAGGLGRASSGGEGSGAAGSLEGVAAGVGELGGGGAGSSGAQQAGGAKRMRRSSGSAAAKSAAGSSGAAAAGGEGPVGGQGGSSSAGAASMLPPARKAVGVGGALAAATAAAAQQGAGGSRYGTRRGSAGGAAAAPTDVSFEPSQQVGYDVGDTPETLLGAGSRGGQRRTAADDAQKQAHMLARLSSLRSRS